jgi:hypothetical protein
LLRFRDLNKTKLRRAVYGTHLAPADFQATREENSGDFQGMLKIPQGFSVVYRRHPLSQTSPRY